MPFHIVQLGPRTNQRIVLKRTYETLVEARAQADKKVEALEGERGYDTLRGYWWCKDKRGRVRFIYVVD